MVFGAEKYEPETATGQKLLAHELTHVVQQDMGLRSCPSLQLQSGEELGSELEIGDIMVAKAVTPEESEEMGSGKKGSGGKKKGSGGKKKASSSKMTLDQIKSTVSSNNKSSLSTEFLICMIWKESCFDSRVRSSKSTALGLMQMTRGAVQEVNDKDPEGVQFKYNEMTDPDKNVDCGTRYLEIFKNRHKDQTKALEHYGTGSGYANKIWDCEKCLKSAKPDETQGCLNNIHEC